VVAEDDLLAVSTNTNADTTAPESCDFADSSPPSGVSCEAEGNDVEDLEAGVVMEDANDLEGNAVCFTVEPDSNGVKVLTRSLSAAELGQLVLHTNQGDRLVPNCCAVCLSPYEPGEDVVWSMNECCIHAFHEECVTEWLTKLQEGNSCPCCRSVFVDSYEDRPVKAICSWRPGPSPEAVVAPSLIGDES
jgi:Ring finger domain